MDIIQRNLFRLLRSGVFQTTEQIEPMSVYKWGRVYQLAVLHDIIPYCYQGLLRCKDQFFLRLTEAQWNEWKTVAEKSSKKPVTAEMEEDSFLRPDHLTNPFLNSRLQAILDDEDSDIPTRRLLLKMIRVIRHILKEGLPIRQMVELGIYLRQHHKEIDFEMLGRWIEDLHLTQMAQLEGEFLVRLCGFEHQNLPFLKEGKNIHVEKIAKELVDFANTRSKDWYFSQGDENIFVHSNTSAIFSHVRRSARYFHYYPSESVTNFFSSFVHSLSHIEE